MALYGGLRIKPRPPDWCRAKLAVAPYEGLRITLKLAPCTNTRPAVHKTREVRSPHFHDQPALLFWVLCEMLASQRGGSAPPEIWKITTICRKPLALLSHPCPSGSLRWSISVHERRFRPALAGPSGPITAHAVQEHKGWRPDGLRLTIPSHQHQRQDNSERRT
jgi:hypothetical protein